MAKTNQKNEKEKFDLKAFLSVQKNRSRVYTAVFFLLVIIFFIINNINNSGEEGPYPPDYLTPKAGNFKQAPVFVLNTVNGTELSLNDFSGKVVLVEFWATWCGACQRITPELVNIKNDYSDKDFEIIGISLDEHTGHDEKAVIDFMTKYKINYPVVHGTEEVIKKYGNIENTPSSFIIDRKGKIYSIYTGLVPKEVLIRDINNLLE